MPAFRQFLARDVRKACNSYIDNHLETLQSARNTKIQKLMGRKFFPKKTELSAIMRLKDSGEWGPNLDESMKLDKVNQLLKLCSIVSADTSVTLDEEYADILHLFF